MKVIVSHSLAEVDASHWDLLGESNYPFSKHAFVYGLEQHNCLEPFGWHPVYFTIYQGNTLAAALPCYIKTNSYGELVFDNAWAQAYERSGLDYYPKLVTAIPYTPATGERFLINRTLLTDEASRQDCRQLLCRAVITFCEKHRLSSWHILFTRESILRSLDNQAIMLRSDIQFHWQNAQYRDFDDFLGALSSRKRKNIRKERRCAHAHGFDITMQAGDHIEAKDWRRIHQLYAGIYERKYGMATLSPEFFQHLGDTLKNQVLAVLVRDQGQIIATSLFFRSDTHLYGRVWGCESFARDLHFECCYYQGIEYCIANQLEWFDPGAQGPHKLSRGFLPRKTWSGHWIAQIEFRRAIAGFLKQELQYIEDYQAQLMQHSPYRKTENDK
ncbi:MAG: GNAT family N-acetyltransferase [Gammaproteobacteria bacterium]|nr:GNAT family N-acetyltransferase [Gammaproteobacteria bacterium]